MSAPPDIVPFYVPEAQNGSITFWWNPTPGATGYVVSHTSTNGTVTRTFGANSRSARFAGLTNGVLYSGSIYATTAGGNTPTVLYYPVQPGTAPDTPPDVNYLVDGNTVTVTWNAPINEGSSRIMWYAVISATANPDDVPAVSFNIEPFKRSHTQFNVPSGTYTFLFYAANAVDWSQPYIKENVVVGPV